MKFCFRFLFVFVHAYSFAQVPATWESIKETVVPAVSVELEDHYEAPYALSIGNYGWEDGLHISRDGLSLYALYFPGDLLGWSTYFANSLSGGIKCEVVENNTYLRSYVDDLGMDMVQNVFGCDSFMNIDLVYAERNALADDFSPWRLSGLARPALIEGGAMPVSKNPDSLSYFLFTGNNDVWMLKGVSNDPNGIELAERLPSPINPAGDEFRADNPHLEKIGNDTLVLVYEKVVSEVRAFYFSLSIDDGVSWSTPEALSAVNNLTGKIEHPHLYHDLNEGWFLYFSLDCDIYRMAQETKGVWTDWGNLELVIEKGSAACIGEPSLTTSGDIAFSVVSVNTQNNDTTDTYDIDPWYLKRKQIATSVQTPVGVISTWVGEVIDFGERKNYTLYNLSGQVVSQGVSKSMSTNTLLKGVYVVDLQDVKTKLILR